MKWVPAHFVAEQLPKLVLPINLGFQPLTGFFLIKQEYMIENVQ